MLSKLTTFFAFPWGRESFLKTISCMKPPKPAPPKIKDHVAWLVHKLKQSSFRLQGFPLTLQLVVFRAIPQLLDFISSPLDHRTCMDLEDGYLSQHKSINYLDIRRVECSSNLDVAPVIYIESQDDPGWGEWSNATNDDRISYMEQLISEKHTFNNAMWPGGVTTKPLLKNPKDRCLRHVKKKLTRVKQSLKPKPLIKKETSSRKQRRISSYFTRSKVNTYSNEQLTEIVLELEKKMQQMQKFLKKRKRRAHGRQTSFHTVMPRSKKHRISHEEDQGAPIDQDVDAMLRDDHDLPQSPIISQYAAQLHREASENPTRPPDANPDETIHTAPVHVSKDTDMNTAEQNPSGQDVDDMDNHTGNVHIAADQKPDDDQVVMDSTDIHTENVHISTDHNPEADEDVDDMDNHTGNVHIAADQKPEHDKVVMDSTDIHAENVHISTDHNPEADEDVDTVVQELVDVHNSPDQAVHPEPQSPRTSQNANGTEEDIQTTPAREETNPKTTETRTFGTLYPGRWDPPSKIYHKADHPDSPEISHILHRCVRIYEKESQDPPSSRGPIFDQTNGPSSLPGIRLKFSPLPFTPLTSPVKSNVESGLGFASHAASPNAFTTTTSSNSPPSIGRPTSAEQEQNQDPIVDLTKTKDPMRHVPGPLENLLAKEFFSSPLIPALDLVTPLPDKEWEFFEQILKINMNVYHATPSGFEFSNNSLLQLAQSNKWKCFATCFLRDTPRFLRLKKLPSPHLYSVQLSTMCLTISTRVKWMEDIHTIYTPMLWNNSHWVGLAINLDMGLVEVLDPLPVLNGDIRMAKWMKPVLSCLPYLVKKVARCELTQFTGDKPFVCSRIPDTYINGRGGDCGPVTMKFLEFHGKGDPAPGMSGITDQTVDIIRKQYAMDIYKTMSCPLPLPPQGHIQEDKQRGYPLVVGVDNLTTYGAQTKENLFRRFYRCEIGVKRKNEHHLFKWVDEAIVDEINMVDAKHSQLKEDVDSFKMYTARRFENQAKQIKHTLNQFKLVLDTKANSFCTQDNSALTTEDTLASPNIASPAYNPLTNIAVGVIAFGTMAWIYAKISN
ncbi:hypothetical protein Bca4012_084202 [Brassica carinata]